MMKPEQPTTGKFSASTIGRCSTCSSCRKTQKYYSFNQLRPQLDEIQSRPTASTTSRTPTAPSSRRQLMKLDNAMNLYQRLEISLYPPGTDDFAAELAAYQKSIAPASPPCRRATPAKNYDQAAFNNLLGFMASYKTCRNSRTRSIVPPATDAKSRADWQNIGTNLMSVVTAKSQPGGEGLRRDGHRLYRTSPPPSTRPSPIIASGSATGFAPRSRKAGQEFFFNDFQPFYKAMVIYVLALLLAYRAADVRAGANCPNRCGARRFIWSCWLGHPHLRPGVSHVARRPAAGDEPLFLRHLHRLGRGHSGHGAGKDLSRSASAARWRRSPASSR